MGLLLLLAACGNAVDAIGFERMKSQAKAKPYASTPYFPDGKVLQAPAAGTIPRERFDASPPPVTAALLHRGRDRFEVYCAACHGLVGDGRSEVAAQMKLRPPPSFHLSPTRDFPRARIYDVISKGFGLMPAYNELRPADRWAIAAYVKALQLSQAVPLASLPAPVRDEAVRRLGGAR